MASQQPLETLLDIRDALCDQQSQYRFLVHSLIQLLKNGRDPDSETGEGAILLLERLSERDEELLAALDKKIC